MPAASDEFEELSDFVLVEMQNSRERIRIEKRGENVLVDVESEHETSHLSLPVETIYFSSPDPGSRLQEADVNITFVRNSFPISILSRPS